MAIEPSYKSITRLPTDSRNASPRKFRHGRGRGPTLVQDPETSDQSKPGARPPMRDIHQILYVDINGSLSITPAPPGQLTNATRLAHRAILTAPSRHAGETSRVGRRRPRILRPARVANTSPVCPGQPAPSRLEA